MKPTFTTPCFIRKNTPELRKSLEELGYKECHYFDYDEDGIRLNPIGFDNKRMWGYFTNFNESYFEEDEGREDCGIDCGENEVLFIALAALRDDRNANQWFTDGKSFEKSAREFPSRYMMMHGHKATADELVEYFGKDEFLL